MTDKIIGVAAIATLAAFLAILVGFVHDVDLLIVLAIVVVMAGYDFYRALFSRR
ncbi:hypothetical protein [Thalassobaculum sp.]|uniref:hypothetical protein n=1 Tax=Thalassobaculum sp. TaxID=2022740 RepID=UPI0032EC67D0